MGQLRSQAFAAFLLVVLSLSFAGQGNAQTSVAVDTTSPRATLQTFLDSVDNYMALSLSATLPYVRSDRFYQSEGERQLRAQANQQFSRASETLDVSGLPPGFRGVLTVESVVRLMDIVARIDLPDLSDIPDHEAMQAAGETSWRIPGTRLEIALVSEGRHAGTYLFSPQTILNLEEIHLRLAYLPAQQKSVQAYLDGLAPYTSDTTLYGHWQNSAGTFGFLPERWSYEMPEWLKVRVLGATIWQWLAALLCEVLGLFLIWLSWYIGGRLGAPRKMRVFATALFIMAYAASATTLLEALQIGGALLYFVGLGSVCILYLSAIWMSFATANVVAEAIIKRQSLLTGGVDSQLIRLGARLVALAFTTLLIVSGTNALGFPAYSLLTGFGVGGLAIALAARDTLSNLLGSIAIMFEKPFRSRDWIKIGDAEGYVERVGFRSTRIRTLEDSVVSIPNNLVVNSMVDNLGARKNRHQHFELQIPYTTPRDGIQSFVDGVRLIVDRHPKTPSEGSHVHLSAFNEGGMVVQVRFYLSVAEYELELSELEKIMFQVLQLSEKLGIKLSGSE